MAACEVVDKSECFQAMIPVFGGQYIAGNVNDSENVSGLPIAQAKSVSMITIS